MINQRRVQQQPGYVLHHRPYRDTSQLLDILTRDFGRIAVVARGSRGPRSRLAGILRPFLPLCVSWVARSELGTLTGAETAGRPIGVSGDGLLAAYYVNELLLFFLHRNDAQTEIFSLYETVIKALNGSRNVAADLRAFELELLGLLGYAINLQHAFGDRDELRADRYYQYRMEKGLSPVEPTAGKLTFSGSVLKRIDAGDFDDPDVPACRQSPAARCHRLSPGR